MKRYIVTLTTEEQEKLREIIAKRSSKSEIVKRAFVLLSLDENRTAGRLSDEEIRQHYQVGQRMIERLRQRFVEDSFEIALNGKKQTRFKEKTFDGRVEARVDCLALFGCAQWSSKMEFATVGGNIGGECGSGINIARTCPPDTKKNELKPWHVKEWLIPSADADYVCAMEAVLDVYERRYAAEHPVVGLDESPQQLIAEVRAGFTDSKGVIHKDFEYKREGVADLHMVCEALQGKRAHLCQRES